MQQLIVSQIAHRFNFKFLKLTTKSLFIFKYINKFVIKVTNQKKRNVINLKKLLTHKLNLEFLQLTAP